MQALFLKNSYLQRCEATVLSVTNEKYVVLDQTLFYPEGGNQVSDKGVISNQGNKFTVGHVSKKEDLIIHYIT